MSMRVAHWIQLSVGALGNKGVPKLAGCLKHQLQHWAHFAIFLLFSKHFGEFQCVWLNALSSVMEPSVTRGFKSWLDA
jgi:hypothetical protein